MFGDLKLLLELQANKDQPTSLIAIFNQNQEKLLELKEKYPQWKSFIKPEVLEVLRREGLPVD